MARGIRANPRTRAVANQRYEVTPSPPSSILYNVVSGSWQSEVASVGANYVDMTDSTFYSKVLRRTVSYSVGLPSDYGSSGLDYPVVWHMHGQQTYPGANNRYLSANWPARYGFAVRDAFVRQHITVFINGLNYSMYVDNYDKSVQFETMFLTELIPLIRATYRTLGAAPQYNALMGFSMGGRGAIYYAMKHDDKFGGCAAYGPPLYDEFYDYQNDGSLTWPALVISPDGLWTADQAEVWRLNSPQGYLKKDHSRLKLRLVYGDSDALRNTTGAPFKARLDTLNIPYTTVTDLVGVSHTAANYWTNADSSNAFAFVETIFAGT